MKFPVVQLEEAATPYSSSKSGSTAELTDNGYVRLILRCQPQLAEPFHIAAEKEVGAGKTPQSLCHEKCFAQTVVYVCRWAPTSVCGETRADRPDAKSRGVKSWTN
jgi:hypothetical protein